MRKGYLIIAAVAVSFLASCSKERVLNDNRDTAKAVISFESYTESSTKADIGNENDKFALEFYHKSFAVFATKKDEDNNVQYVFGDTAQSTGTTCYYTGNGEGSYYGTNWRYEDERFWDKHSYYNMVAWAPADTTGNPLRFVFGNTKEVGALGVDGRDIVAPNYYLTGKNLQQAMPIDSTFEKGFNVNGQDLDMMTSDIVSRPGIMQGSVEFAFKHILAKLNVSLAKTEKANGATVIVDSVIITGLRDMGSYEESKFKNDETGKHSGWTLAAANHNPNYELAYRAMEGHPQLPEAAGDTLKPLYFIESLVMPQTVPDNAKLTIKFKVTKGKYNENYSYSIKFKDVFESFLDRSYYTVKFKIDIQAIIFDVETGNWDSDSGNNDKAYTLD